MVDAAEIDPQPLLTARRDRIEKPDALDVFPAASATTVRHYDVIERALDRAAACQPNDYHSETLSSKNAKAARRTARKARNSTQFGSGV
jgi:hypothetical protein